MIFKNKKLYFLIIFIIRIHDLFGMSRDTTRPVEPLKASANILVTQNGISVLPNFMLGKPATIINISLGKKHLYFEPELRWQLNGNPWAYIFRMKYRSNISKKLSYTIDIRPSYIFRKNKVTIDGEDKNRWITTRNLSGEFLPVWRFSNNFQLGASLLWSRGLDDYGAQRNTYFAIQPKFSKIAISPKYYFGYFPQLFYLSLDAKSGYYYSQSISLNKEDFPFYLTSIFTYKIRSTVDGDKIVWNVGINYRI